VAITLVTGSLLFRSYGESLLMLLNLLLIMLVVAFLKQQVFPDHLRPGLELLPIVPLKLAPGLKLHQLHSFPSGHTASAFGMFYLLSVFFGSRAYSALFFTLALLVGISRVFLIQHYFEDIYFGSLTGIGISLLLLQAEKKWLCRGIPGWYHLSILKRRP
jgi:membrane-associated phospholipid phosphatase